MPRQLHTLFLLNSAIQSLDMIEECINEARDVYSGSEAIQSNLDREQIRLRIKRSHLLMQMLEIASSN
jgi:hypothetical protein